MNAPIAAPMNCPCCGSPMTHLLLDGRLGTKVDIHLCTSCSGFWFDHHDSLRLAPGAILKLFSLMAQSNQQGAPVPTARLVQMPCPCCAARLVLTHDMQHATKFQYWRCPLDHGHFITFLEFLREKDFVRPLSPQQIAELRENVQTVNCSNCGGPIDLTKGSTCPHCGSPLTMLDMKQMREMVSHLAEASQAHRIDPSLPVRLDLAKLETDAHFAWMLAETGRGGGRSGSLLDAGLQFLAAWLKGSA